MLAGAGFEHTPTLGVRTPDIANLRKVVIFESGVLYYSAILSMNISNLDFVFQSNCKEWDLNPRLHLENRNPGF